MLSTNAIQAPAGTYLAFYAVFAALTGRSPVGNAYLAGLDAQTVALLRNVRGTP